MRLPTHFSFAKLLNGFISSAMLAFLLCAAGPAIAQDEDLREETYKNLEVFSNVLLLLQEHYVDTIDPQQVITGAINGMLSSLDPHSSYMTPEDYQELQEETHGSFSGIGLEITNKDGILTVVSPIEDTPAFRSGLQAGDQIISIEGELTKNMSLMDAVKKLRGRKGTSVTISIFRDEWQELKEFKMIRDDIPLHSVKSMELEPGIFYIRISNFQANTTRDLTQALRKQEASEPIKGLILDLRKNPGGLLDQAIRVSDVFLQNGIIVSTRGRNSEQNMVFEASDDETDSVSPLIVLVDGGSASASEIVAGALQDHDRAIIVGTETFGKGSVQTVIPMSNGAGLRLTTAKYYTPSGESIQATGIRPDIKVPRIIRQENDQPHRNGLRSFREKDLPNHIENDRPSGKKTPAGSEESAPEISDAENRLHEDNQLRTALYILKGLLITSQQNMPIEAEEAPGQK